MREVRSEKGMLTVEVVLGITVYMAFFVLLLNYINIIYVRQKFQAALKPVAIQISRDYRTNASMLEWSDQDAAGKLFLNEKLNRDYYISYSVDYDYSPDYDFISKAQRDFYFMLYEKKNNYIISENISAMRVVDGKDGIDFCSTKINEAGDGMLDLTINYEIRLINLPFFEDAGIDIDMEQHAYTKLW